MRELFKLVFELKAEITIRNSAVIKNAYEIRVTSQRGIQDVTLTVTDEFLEHSSLSEKAIIDGICRHWQEQTR